MKKGNGIKKKSNVPLLPDITQIKSPSNPSTLKLIKGMKEILKNMEETLEKEEQEKKKMEKIINENKETILQLEKKFQQEKYLREEESISFVQILEKSEEEKKNLELQFKHHIEETNNIFQKQRLMKMDIEDLKKLKMITHEHLDVVMEIIAKRSNEMETKKICAVCLTNEAIIALSPCGHCCLCETCSLSIKKRCPICNQEFLTRLKIFI